MSIDVALSLVPWIILGLILTTLVWYSLLKKLELGGLHIRLIIFAILFFTVFIIGFTYGEFQIYTCLNWGVSERNMIASLYASFLQSVLCGVMLGLLFWDLPPIGGVVGLKNAYSLLVFLTGLMLVISYFVYGISVFYPSPIIFLLYPLVLSIIMWSIFIVSRIHEEIISLDFKGKEKNSLTQITVLSLIALYVYGFFEFTVLGPFRVRNFVSNGDVLFQTALFVGLISIILVGTKSIYDSSGLLGQKVENFETGSLTNKLRQLTITMLFAFIGVVGLMLLSSSIRGLIVYYLDFLIATILASILFVKIAETTLTGRVVKPINNVLIGAIVGLILTHFLAEWFYMFFGFSSVVYGLIISARLPINAITIGAFAGITINNLEKSNLGKKDKEEKKPVAVKPTVKRKNLTTRTSEQKTEKEETPKPTKLEETVKNISEKIGAALPKRKSLSKEVKELTPQYDYDYIRKQLAKLSGRHIHKQKYPFKERLKNMLIAFMIENTSRSPMLNAVYKGAPPIFKRKRRPIEYFIVGLILIILGITIGFSSLIIGILLIIVGLIVLVGYLYLKPIVTIGERKKELFYVCSNCTTVLSAEEALIFPSEEYEKYSRLPPGEEKQGFLIFFLESLEWILNKILELLQKPQEGELTGEVKKIDLTSRIKGGKIKYEEAIVELETPLKDKVKVTIYKIGRYYQVLGTECLEKAPKEVKVTLETIDPIGKDRYATNLREKFETKAKRSKPYEYLTK